MYSQYISFIKYNLMLYISIKELRKLNFRFLSMYVLIPVAVPFREQVCGFSFAGVTGPNSTEGMDVLPQCCVFVGSLLLVYYIMLQQQVSSKTDRFGTVQSESKYRVHCLFSCRYKTQIVVYANFTQCAVVTSGAVSTIQLGNFCITHSDAILDSRQDLYLQFVLTTSVTFLQFSCVYIIVLLFYTVSA